MNRILTHFRNFLIFIVLGLIIVFINVVADSSASTDLNALKVKAWKAWQNGDIDRAAEIAAQLIQSMRSSTKQ